MKVAAFGDNCIDYYPKLNRFYPTGNAVDTAVNIRKLGIPASIVTTVGDDDYGKIMIEAFRRQGLDFSHTKILHGATAVTIMDMDGNERVHGEWIEGVLGKAEYTPEDIAFIGSHDYVHITYYGNTEQYLTDLKSWGAKTSFDYSNFLQDEIIERTVKYIDYPFFSYTRRDAFIEEFLQDKVAKGCKIAVATLGPNGSLAFDGKQFYTCGIVETKIVNTIGAGDSYIAGFICGLANGLPTEACMAQGAKVASEVIGVFGPWRED